MSGSGLITIDAERFLELLDKLKVLEEELRKLGHGGFSSSKSNQRPKPSQEEKEAMPLELDITGIEWKQSRKAGGGVAGPSDGWAWAFVYTQDGGIRREVSELLSALQQYGAVIVDGFKITLSGRDDTLLNRTKVR